LALYAAETDSTGGLHLLNMQIPASFLFHFILYRSGLLISPMIYEVLYVCRSGLSDGHYYGRPMLLYRLFDFYECFSLKD